MWQQLFGHASLDGAIVAVVSGRKGLVPLYDSVRSTEVVQVYLGIERSG